MNNRQTNRRRGRGNNNRTQNNNRNGYDNLNRIDNRARGNASQMLEKYKKLAQDAQLNGDRVQAEYYHQFADHYFRVLADFRSRQEESRPQREWRDDREGAEGSDWRDDEAVEAEASEGEDSDSNLDAGEREERDDNRPRNRSAQNQNRNDRPERQNRNDRPRRDRQERFSRDDRPQNEPEQTGLDLAALPPAIGFAANDEDGETAAEGRPARKPRARRPKADDAEAVAAAE